MMGLFDKLFGNRKGKERIIEASIEVSAEEALKIARSISGEADRSRALIAIASEITRTAFRGKAIGGDK